jgi:ribonuclease D
MATVDTTVTGLAQRARETGRLGIDTEFMGEGRYGPLLCLAQVAVEDPDNDDGGDVRVEVLDPLQDSFDPTPLAAVLADPDVEIVLHAGRQDVALLRRVWGTEVRNIFDTQVAAGFAGRRAQLGYEALLSELTGVRLRKSASFTRWDARPLSEEQVRYAREDVLHLLQLADALQDELAERGRLEWAREECRALEDVSDERDAEQIFARLPRVNSLDPAQRAVARELVEWREATARDGDRPVPSVLPDAALVEVAKRRPASMERLAQIRGLNEGTLRRRGPAIVAAVERGRERDPIPTDGVRTPPPDPGDAPLIALAEALVRARAAEAELAYELLAARADLQRIVTALREGTEEPEVRTLQGWRRELVGLELLELLAGRRSLLIGPGRRIEVSP